MLSMPSPGGAPPRGFFYTPIPRFSTHKLEHIMATQTLSPEALADIEELRAEIAAFRAGQSPEDRFKAFRLTRGVYGQRQPGVQMVRIKLPYGRVTGQQLATIADLAEQYGHGNLHLTTRQNIQLHHVALDETPDLWERLEAVGITLRASCGNTVRNITASPLAGVDPEEAFDVTPYAHAAFAYFLRHPVGWEMGRKIKIAFSASDRDSAFTYIHDFGFTPVLRPGKLGPERGFRVVVGGGLGAQAILAKRAYDFLPEEHLIPFLEAALRIFDRYGERERRHKARLKFLIKDWGLDRFLEEVHRELTSLGYREYPIDEEHTPAVRLRHWQGKESLLPAEKQVAFRAWSQYNVVAQKQSPWYAVKVRVPLGNLSVEVARRLSAILPAYSGDDTRLTVNQGLILRYVHPHALPGLYLALEELGLHLPGFDTLADVTSCPGSDTCNLAVTNSTRLASQLESVVREDFPELVGNADAQIKISGCMNACGQHMIAAIGLHGSSLKYGEHRVVPAQQVVLGGGITPSGEGRMGDKVIKLPTKRIPEALRRLLLDFVGHRQGEETFQSYYLRQGGVKSKYFYHLLKPLAQLDDVTQEELLDWGQSVDFVPEIGTGECAGVMVDLVATILQDAEDRLVHARRDVERGLPGYAQYHGYTAAIVAAKALLLGEDVSVNSQHSMVEAFEEHFGHRVDLPQPFSAWVLRHQEAEDTLNPFWVRHYLDQTEDFLKQIQGLRTWQSAQNPLLDVQPVITHQYKA